MGDLTFLTEDELLFHENVYEIIYIDDILKEKKQEKNKKDLIEKNKKDEELFISKRNLFVNKLLNIFIVIVVVLILISLCGIIFSSKIESFKEKLEVNKNNKEIEKLVESGDLLPAYMYDVEEDDENIEDSMISDLITINGNSDAENLDRKTSSFIINDEVIHNFNESFSIIVPDSSYVQSVNDNKVLMLNSDKIYELNLLFKDYEVVEQHGNYYLFVNLIAENKNHPENLNIDGIFTAQIENDIIVSNKDNSNLSIGESKNTTISFNLTEYQYKLIKNEIDSIDFVYKDKYNCREIFATYGGNYKK